MKSEESVIFQICFLLFLGVSVERVCYFWTKGPILERLLNPLQENNHHPSILQPLFFRGPEFAPPFREGKVAKFFQSEADSPSRFRWGFNPDGISSRCWTLHTSKNYRLERQTGDFGGCSFSTEVVFRLFKRSAISFLGCKRCWLAPKIMLPKPLGDQLCSHHQSFENGPPTISYYPYLSTYQPRRHLANNNSITLGGGRLPFSSSSRVVPVRSEVSNAFEKGEVS